MTKTINSKKDFIEDCENWCEGFQNTNKVLIAYVRRGPVPTQTILMQSEDGTVKAARRGRRRPQGVVAAYRGTDGIIRIGWSLCRKTETFNSKVGIRYALERAVPLSGVKQQFVELSRLSKLRKENDILGQHTYKEPDHYPPQSIRKTLAKVIERTEKL